MKLSGETTIWADRETVWASLHDVDILAACVPGCRSLERVSRDRFEIAVDASAGPVSAILEGSVEIAESRPPCHLRLHARGGGAAVLQIAGSVRISLSPCVVGTRASWDVEAEPAGLLLRLSAPFLAGLARKQVDQFARTFAAVVGRPPTSRHSDKALDFSRPPSPA